MDKFSVLQQYFGHSSFRPGQEQVVDAIISGQDVLGVMPTGAGKSVCYQVPAMLMPGLTLVISPLISLMQDQVAALEEEGVHAACLNSALPEGLYSTILRAALEGDYKILYVAPERLLTDSFLYLAMHARIAFVAVDEAHCVSQWGQDFRPSYLKIAEFISRLPYRPVIGAFTATATEQVKQDIIALLQLNQPFTLTTGFDRPNLYFGVARPRDKERYIEEYILDHRDRSGIVYCATRKSVESVCKELRSVGISATRYHAGLTPEERSKNQEDFVYDRKRVMVATNAFGMGIDKSNVSFVLHYNMPKNLENYYQEAGRAGRDGERAECILLFSLGDVQTAKYFIQNSHDNDELTPEQAEAAARRDRERLDVMVGYCTVAALLLFIMISAGLSSCGAMFSGLTNGVLGTSYTSEDSDLVAVENNYAALENGLQSEIDNIESTHPGYDEYRYDLDSIGHNPHELASYLTALLQSYTPQSAQAELERIFSMQYTLTLTEEVEIRYRTETSTDPETGETTTEEVPYEYYILNVKLTNKLISELAEELLTPQQLEMFHVYLETSGNKPLIFGGGSPDGSPSEDLSGVEFVNGTRPGNQELMELAKQQVGNVGGYPYWSWYGFNSRVEWCACFVSWCYNQAGKSEPRFAGCEWQGVPWFQSRGQWGARGYENIAPGDAIFFDWDLDGVADHVGLVLGRDGSRVYTVEGNSGDACKIKSYDLNYQCIKGYGLMNW